MPNQPYAIVIEDDPKLGQFQKRAVFVDLDTNGDKYRSFLDLAEPALVILDLHLPFAFGGDILEVIRARYSNTVVAIVTADLYMANTFTGRAEHVLIKPVSVASLLKLAESVKG